ncbi:MAG: hypothetical protein U0Y10_08415 [Spirosomataceae bacterium]
MKKQVKKLQLRHERIVRLNTLHTIAGGAVSTRCGSYDACWTTYGCPPPQYDTTIIKGLPTYNQGVTIGC